MSSDNGNNGSSENGSRTTGMTRKVTPHEFRGKGARRPRRKHQFSQASTRRPATGSDQHGRPWSMQVGLKSGMPAGGPPQPLFTAPWYPDHQYVRVNPDNAAEIFIDYEAMFLRRNAKLAEYHERAVERAHQKSLPLPKKGEYSAELISVCGSVPKPVQPVVAAMQENPWILGETDVVDARLEPFVRKSRGKALAEAQAFDFGPRSYAEATSGTLGAPIPRAISNAPRGESIEEGQARIERELAAAGRTADDLEDDGGDGAGDDVLDGANVDVLLDGLGDGLDDEFDEEALGGRTVAPKNTELAKRQAPRRPNASARGKGGGSKAKRPTLADGAKPVIGGRSDA